MPCSRVSIVNFEQVNAGWDSMADKVLNLFLPCFLIPRNIWKNWFNINPLISKRTCVYRKGGVGGGGGRAVSFIKNIM